DVLHTLFDSPATVDIDIELRIRPDGLAHETHPLQVSSQVSTHLDFYRLEPLGDFLGGDGCSIFRSAQADAELDGDARGIHIATQHFINGYIEQFTLQIQQCHLDGRLCKSVIDDRRIDALHDGIDIKGIAT